MTSSNRHWPSMFKSKPNHNELNSGSQRSGLGNEERTPEPKPRWNPRPEQIRILEAIFNSGMVNPPRDEIRKIRAQLQEFGQVGDANVFYWFQNRKSRSKHKQRHGAAAKTTGKTSQAPPPPANAAPAPNSYSTSSSDKSSTGKTLSAANMIDLMNSNSPTASVNNQHFVPAPNEFLSEPFFFPAQDLGHGFGFSGGVNVNVNENCQNFLLSELMLMSNCPSKTRDVENQDKNQNLSYVPTGVCVSDPSHHFLPPPFSAPNNQILQGLAEPVGPARSSTVFINDVCFEVGAGPFSVREAFGDDVVLLHSSGQPVLIDEWGFTAQPLQHGGFYYLMRQIATPLPDGRTINLI